MIEQFRFEYRVPHRESPAFCHVRIYEAGTYGRLHVAVLTEAQDNPGMSVTNACEYIATELVALHGLTPGHVIWIEHYPDRHPAGMEGGSMFDLPAQAGESFDLVTFEWDGDRAASPDWRRVSRAWVEQLVGNL